MSTLAAEGPVEITGEKGRGGRGGEGADVAIVRSGRGRKNVERDPARARDLTPIFEDPRLPW